jgi:tetratricopeptide (TPR) repeat protein
LRVWAKVLAAQGSLSESEPARQLLQQSLALLERPELADRDTRPEMAFVLLTTDEKRGTWREGTGRLLERSLALYRALDDRWGIAHALRGLGAVAAWSLSDFGRAKRLRQESLEILRALGDQMGMATALMSLAWSAVQQGQIEEGARSLEDSLALAQKTGDSRAIANGLQNLGAAHLYLGQYAKAHSLLEQSLTLWHDLGSLRGLAEATIPLGRAKMHLGQYQQARSLGEKGLSICRETDFPRGLGGSFRLLGNVALAESAYADAQGWLLKGIALCRALDIEVDVRMTLAVLACAVRGLGQLPEARQYLGEALRKGFGVQRFWPCLYAVLMLSLVLADEGEVERAVELYALASRYPRVANSRWFEDVAGRHIATVAATLPPDVVAAARERGRARDLEATVEELLAELRE